jgi:hypothetical protein
MKEKEKKFKWSKQRRENLIAIQNRRRISVGDRVYIYCDLVIGTPEKPQVILLTGHILKVQGFSSRKGLRCVTVRYRNKKNHFDRLLNIRQHFVRKVQENQLVDKIFSYDKFVN